MSDRSTQPGVVVGLDGSLSSTLAVREPTIRNVAPTVVHVSSPLAVWPAVSIPAEIHRQHGRDARKLIADAIKVAEDSVQGGNRPDIDSELLCAALVPSLIELSERAHIMAVGCRGMPTALSV